MRTPMLSGVSLLALALMPAPLLAQAQSQSSDGKGDLTPQQTPNQPAAASAPATGGSPIDTPIDDGAQAATPPAPTGDPVADRLNALEFRLNNLQAENKALKDQISSDQARLQSVEARSSKALAFGWGPTLSDVGGKFTFKPRGVIDADFVHFEERRGGYDFSDGTGFRRARIGFQGTAFKNFNWVIEADFAGNVVNLQDAYLQYVGVKKWAFTLGQFKQPFGFESNNSDNYNLFMERGMANNAMSTAIAERRIGGSVAYLTDTLNASVSFSGENESVTRATARGGALGRVPDESWGVNGRVTWEPIFEDGKILHVGAGTAYRWNLRSGDTPNAFRLSDRPNVRVDGGNIVDTGVIGGFVENGLAASKVTRLFYAGAEAAGIYGPFMLFGEYNRLRAERPAFKDLTFDGYYIAGSFFLTGETHPLKNGNLDRVKPFTTLGENGGWGAFELVGRYDMADFSDTPRTSAALTSAGQGRAGNKAHSFTAGLTWYLNPYAKLMFNWVRFTGERTALVAQPSTTTTAFGEVKGDAFATRLHLDW